MSTLSRIVAFTAIIVSFSVLSSHSLADNPTPYADTVVTKTSLSYGDLVGRLETAINDNRMGLVARASATAGANSIGVTIPGNTVIMVFNPKFAVRMLEASVAAGIEAPIRYYITENDDGTATLTYRKPSSVFEPYENEALNEMAAELDVIFEKIANQATAG
ncbi:MAG: DUF302 domain-containing protein [Gammaproteobacteria bacterium]|nr:DUF302 domain-containing protein [Gammaproteobacteria bacterium]